MLLYVQAIASNESNRGDRAGGRSVATDVRSRAGPLSTIRRSWGGVTYERSKGCQRAGVRTRRPRFMTGSTGRHVRSFSSRPRRAGLWGRGGRSGCVEQQRPGAFPSRSWPWFSSSQLEIVGFTRHSAMDARGAGHRGEEKSPAVPAAGQSYDSRCAMWLGDHAFRSHARAGGDWIRMEIERGFRDIPGRDQHRQDGAIF